MNIKIGAISFAFLCLGIIEIMLCGICMIWFPNMPLWIPKAIITQIIISFAITVLALFGK